MSKEKEPASGATEGGRSYPLDGNPLDLIEKNLILARIRRSR